MIYLSKGMKMHTLEKSKVLIIRGEKQYALGGREAEIWLEGERGFAEIYSETDRAYAYRLVKRGLMELESEDDAPAVQKYRILTRCICCPVNTGIQRSSRLNWSERETEMWLKKAGIRLSMAELVCLREHPERFPAVMFGEENRKELILSIYKGTGIEDNLLEHQMEQAGCRDAVVESVIGLLRKRKIVLF